MRTINHNLRRWLYIAGICIGVIILLAIVFRGCLPINSHKEEKKEVQHITQTVNRAWDSTARELQLSKLREDSLRRVNERQSEQLAANRKELAQSRQQIRETVAALDQAKALGDTIKYMEVADSLRNKIVSQDAVIEKQDAITDSTILTYKRQLNEKDRKISMQAELLSKMRTANLEIETRYTALHSDYTKISRKLKGERTVGRLLAGGAVVLAGLLIAK